jgi:S1-C subfamily serine protease
VPRLGVVTQQDPQGIVVVGVDEGSAAAAAGLKPGDYLVAVGDIAVEDQTFGAKLRAKYSTAAEGTALPIKVKRGAETLTLAGRLQFAAGDVILDSDPRASAKAVRIREGLLRGTVDR